MQQGTDVKGWDTGYEWKIILILSLTFGLVGLDRFHPAGAVPGLHGRAGPDLSGSRQPGRYPGHFLGHLGLCHGLPVRSGGASQGPDPCGDHLLADVRLLGFGRRPGEPAADPRGDGARGRAGRFHRRCGGRGGLAPEAARHEQRHLPVHDLAVRQRDRADHRDSVACWSPAGARSSCWSAFRA